MPAKMRLNVSHTTEYRYSEALQYALQRIRLVPRTSACQTVHSWKLTFEGAREEVRFVDHLDNDTRLSSAEPGAERIRITASGEIETINRDGVFGPHKGYAPLWLFLPETELTAKGEGVEEIVAGMGSGSDLERLHRLVAQVGDRVKYEVGTTDAATPAEEAIERGRGVCQDHAHVFIAASRSCGIPARYVSGYLMRDDTSDQAASHAWAEAHVDGLGWVGFDVSNRISPDERYVRLAVGRDYRDAMPIDGIRLGSAEESLAVHISVEQ